MFCSALVEFPSFRSLLPDETKSHGFASRSVRPAYKPGSPIMTGCSSSPRRSPRPHPQRRERYRKSKACTDFEISRPGLVSTSPISVVPSRTCMAPAIRPGFIEDTFLSGWQLLSHENEPFRSWFRLSSCADRRTCPSLEAAAALTDVYRWFENWVYPFKEPENLQPPATVRRLSLALCRPGEVRLLRHAGHRRHRAAGRGRAVLFRRPSGRYSRSTPG